MAELADLMREIADGGAPTIGRTNGVGNGALTVLPPPDERSVGVLAFTGHHIVSADLPDAWVRAWLTGDDLSAPLRPPFLTVLAAATGRVPDDLDMTLVAGTTGRPNGMDLTELDEFLAPLPGRLAGALARRIGVRAWRCPGGLLTLGRGVGGRWEASVEVEPALRGFGLGRGLFTAARGLLPAGEHVWAQVAPGNAASVRAALAAGFRPVGAEVLLRPAWSAGGLVDGGFDWFADLVEPTTESAGEPGEAASDEADGTDAGRGPAS